jgi:hypothetical protein
MESGMSGESDLPASGVLHVQVAEDCAMNERRVLPKAEKSVIRHAQDALFSGLKAADYLRYDMHGRHLPSECCRSCTV